MLGHKARKIIGHYQRTFMRDHPDPAAPDYMTVSDRLPAIATQKEILAAWRLSLADGKLKAISPEKFAFVNVGWDKQNPPNEQTVEIGCATPPGPPADWLKRMCQACGLVHMCPADTYWLKCECGSMVFDTGKRSEPGPPEGPDPLHEIVEFRTQTIVPATPQADKAHCDGVGAPLAVGDWIWLRDVEFPPAQITGFFGSNGARMEYPQIRTPHTYRTTTDDVREWRKCAAPPMEPAKCCDRCHRAMTIWSVNGVCHDCVMEAGDRSARTCRCGRTNPDVGQTHCYCGRPFTRPLSLSSDGTGELATEPKPKPKITADAIEKLRKSGHLWLPLMITTPMPTCFTCSSSFISQAVRCDGGEFQVNPGDYKICGYTKHPHPHQHRFCAKCGFRWVEPCEPKPQGLEHAWKHPPGDWRK